MGVELTSISIFQVEDNVIYGSFRLKNYENLRVEFECENESFSFSYLFGRESEQNAFQKWLHFEKDVYAKFMLNYLNEIKRLNEIPMFKGEFEREISTNFVGEQIYLIDVKYEGFHKKVNFNFSSHKNHAKISYQFPIPINSEGEYSREIQIEGLLTKETIQRMWEPFRDKTKYRLNLMHVLR